MTLRRELSKTNPGALSRAHVARGIFLERLIPPDVRGSGKITMAEVKNGYEALGGKFIEYAEPKQLLTGVWLTGPVPRPFPEKNYPALIHYRDPDGNLVHQVSDWCSGAAEGEKITSSSSHVRFGADSERLRGSGSAAR